MKTRSFIVLFFLFSAVNLYAQTEPGKTFVGAGTNLDLSFINTKIKVDNDLYDVGKSSSFEFSPQLGKFATLNFLIGGVMPINISTESDEDDNKQTITSWAIGPFTRVYFGEEDTKFFLNGMAGLGKYSIKSDSGSDSKESAGLNTFQLGAGVAFFLSDHVSLDLFLNYASTTMKPSESSDYRIKNRGIGMGLNFNFIL